MGTIKIVSWNICDLDALTKGSLSQHQQKRKESIIREIRDLSPDILCVLEGPEGEDGIDLVSNQWLSGEWVSIKATDRKYEIRGKQWIWFLVRKKYSDMASLLPVRTWDAFPGNKWEYCPWGEFKKETHSHYRHPQVLILDWNGFRVEFIGLHLKSKFVPRDKTMWEAGGEQRNGFIRKALLNRIKMATEATNVRDYIDDKFKKEKSPAIFVMGDLNDGPGKEVFEKNYLFFDLISNIQGDIFFARRFLNHALFDYAEDLRWSVWFEDFVDPDRDPRILLDHILFTQGMVDGSLPWKIDAHAGKVEHDLHNQMNPQPQEAFITSDHTPISVIVTTKD